LFLVFPIFDSSSSIASTGESGVSTLRSTDTRLRSSSGSRSSSFRVPLSACVWLDRIYYDVVDVTTL
jgi:hypothetical protein